MKIPLFAALWALASPVLAQTPQQIASLQAQITALKAQVASLSATVANQTKATTATDTGQSAAITALQAQTATILASQIWAVNPFVSVDPGFQNGLTGPHITFKGVNIHLVDGSGYTDGGISEKYTQANGLGNLIIGYNIAPLDLITGERSASHMLILGDNNKYTGYSYAGIVSGQYNYVNGSESCIIGGEGNRVNENNSSILQAANAVLTGGSFNLIAGGYGDSTTNGCNTALFGGLEVNGNPAFFSAAVGGINSIVIGVTGIPGS